MIGQTISHYQITAKLGEGGMGVVYRARDSRLNRDVAVKVLNYEHARDEDVVRRFLQEARAAAKLKHPNVVGISDLGEDGPEITGKRQTEIVQIETS